MVEILVDLDAYWKLVKPQIINGTNEGLTAQSTVFGWVLSDSVPNCNVAGSAVSHQMLSITDQHATSFRDLESVCISPFGRRFRSDFRSVKESLKQNNDERYGSALLWKPFLKKS